MDQKNIFLLLGTNIGDRIFNLQQCINLIERQIGLILLNSKVYETSAWGKTDQPHFLNQAIKIKSQLTPIALLEKIQSIEKSMGRILTEKWEERIIDIDIIYFDELIINSLILTLPHPHLPERKFALIPLVEISPDYIHPLLKKSNTTLLAECQDTLSVKLFTN